MENMHIAVEITKDDEIALRKYHFKKSKPFGSKPFLITVSVIALIGVIWIIKTAIDNKVKPFDIFLIAGGLILAMGIYFLFPLLSSVLALYIGIWRVKSNKNDVVDRCAYALAEEGVSGSSDYGSMVMKWNQIKSVDEDEKYIFISSDIYGIHIIPKRYFSSPGESEKFENALKKHLNAFKQA